MNFARTSPDTRHAELVSPAVTGVPGSMVHHFGTTVRGGYVAPWMLKRVQHDEIGEEGA